MPTAKNDLLAVMPTLMVSEETSRRPKKTRVVAVAPTYNTYSGDVTPTLIACLISHNADQEFDKEAVMPNKIWYNLE